MKHYVDCHSFEDAENMRKQCEAEGFTAEVYRLGSCHFEVQFWKEV